MGEHAGHFCEIPPGDSAILTHSQVFKPETKPGALEKPVHEDVRGGIHRLEMQGTKVNLIHTKKGFMRSGDLHTNKQFDAILSGKVELWTLHNGQTIKKVLGPHTYIVIHPHVPHLFNFLEDTVMLEWWDGPFEAWYYKPYRDIIDEQFAKMTKQG